MERHECFFVKRREIGQKKTGKNLFSSDEDYDRYTKCLQDSDMGEKVTKTFSTFDLL